MRHVRSSLLLVAVALAAALGVWAALSVLVPRGAEPRAPAESSGQSQGLAVDAAATLSDAGSAPALAAPDETAEVDSTAAEILQQQQLAAYGRAQPQRAGTDGGTGGSSVGGGSGVADTIGEAAGALRPSQYHGVVWSPPTQNWKAQYAVESTKNGGSGRTLDLGYFENEEQAAYAYDEAARRRGNGYAPNYALNFPTTERGFVADEILLPSRQKCARVPPDEPLRRPGIGQQLSSSDCAFMPLARPEPYLSHQLALLTDVIATLNKSLAPAARMPVMPWAGSLLGAYRDGDLIPWTSDGDVLIPLKLMEALQHNDGPEVTSLFEAGIVTFRSDKTQRFCYHERAPRYADSVGGYCPGSWSVCGGGSYISHSAVVTYVDGYGGSIDASAAAGIGKQVSVQHHRRLGKCVLADDLRPSAWCKDTAGTCRNPSMVSIRGVNFIAPANAQKIITALYGWEWQTKDPQKRGGGGNAGGGGDVCAWPHRPDGQLRDLVRAGAGAVIGDGAAGGGPDGTGGGGGDGGGEDTALFASALGDREGTTGGERQKSGSRHAHKQQGGQKQQREKRPPPTTAEMTSLLLG